MEWIPRDRWIPPTNQPTSERPTRQLYSDWASSRIGRELVEIHIIHTCTIHTDASAQGSITTAAVVRAGYKYSTMTQVLCCHQHSGTTAANTAIYICMHISTPGMIGHINIRIQQYRRSLYFCFVHFSSPTTAVCMILNTKEVPQFSC